MAQDKENKKGFLDKLLHHSPKVIITVVCLAVVSFFVIAGYLIKTTKFSGDNPVVAEMGKKKI